MPLRPKIASLFRSLFRQSRLERELDEELQGYLEERIADKIRSGVTPVQAQREALLEMGGVEQVKEEVRSARIGHGIETTIRDIQYGWRTLRRSPGFSGVVILTLALCIGANVAMFSVMRSVLWRPLPYPDAGRIVVVQVDARGVSNAGAAPGEVLDLRAESRLVDRLATVAGVEAHLDVAGELERVAAASVTEDVLPLLGAIPPALGRTFRADEYVATRTRSVVISDSLWRRGFGADPAIVGRQVSINNIPGVEIIGVLPRGFRVFLPPFSNAAEEIDVWYPTALEDTRGYRGFFTMGRLRPGATLEGAQAEFDALAARFVQAHPSAYPDGALRLSLEPLQEALTREVRPALAALAVAVGFVLLIGCVNIANLMLARTKQRERELAVRRALGAGRSRLARQLLTESLMLAAAAGAAGLLVGRLGLELVGWLRPTHIPLQSQITMDVTVAIYAVALSFGTALVFGFLPALRVASEGKFQPLKAGRSETSSPGSRRLQRSLVIAEVALSIVPLVAAGLMLRTFVNLVQAPIGFDPTKVITARVSISLRMLENVEQRWPFYQDVVERVSRLPGVEAVSATRTLPFEAMQPTRRYRRDDDPDSPWLLGTQQGVMPGYLQLTGTTLLEGRDFSAEDIDLQQRVVVVDEKLARQLWPEGALGRRLLIERGRANDSLEVIGVTNAIRVTSVRDEAMPHFFVPYHLSPGEVSLVVKTEASAESVGAAIKRSVEPLGTGRAVSDIRPMSDYVADSIGDTRFTLLVLGGFGGASLLLAAVGLYGTLAYLISQRTREFGLRMALGASVGDVVRMVMREGAALTAVGATIGFTGSFGITRALRGMLYNVTPFDGVTVLAATATISIVAIAASSLPAWRASRIDPNLALRSE
jgi:predicted permease